MSSVPAIFLNKVADEPAQAGVKTVRRGDCGGLVEPVAGQSSVESGARSFDGAIPQRVESIRCVGAGGGRLPVVAAAPAGRVPR